MLRTVKLYGILGETFGKEWTLDIDTPAEAIRALIANNPKIKKFLLESEQKGFGYRIRMGEYNVEEDDELFNPLGRQDLKIIPTIFGAGKKQRKGWGQIILGAVLVAAGWVVSGIPGMQLLGKAIMQAGVGLMLQGVATLLSPTPQKPESAEQTVGYNFHGPEITINQGVPIPLCYGQLIVGGGLISSGIVAEEYDP